MPITSHRLLLLRHAESDRPSGIPDYDRRLSLLGIEQAGDVGSYLALENLVPDIAVVSKSVRTRATWDVVQKKLPRVVSAIFDERIYEAHPSAILDAIRSISAKHHTLLLVGHNPGLHSVALQLVGQAEKNEMGRLRYNFPPASLVVIKFDVAGWGDISDQSGTLEHFITPGGAS